MEHKIDYHNTDAVQRSTTIVEFFPQEIHAQILLVPGEKLLFVFQCKQEETINVFVTRVRLLHTTNTPDKIKCSYLRGNANALKKSSHPEKGIFIFYIKEKFGHHMNFGSSDPIACIKAPCRPHKEVTRK